MAMRMPESINMSLFLQNLVGKLKVMAMVALTGVGVLGPQEEPDVYSEEQPSSYVIVMDRQTPAMVPVSVAVARIKKRVPVVEYGSFHEDGDGVVCSVCLDCISGSHEIRQLSNCCHVFHKECLDSWVDEGQVTCPLCRSMLLPAK